MMKFVTLIVDNTPHDSPLAGVAPPHIDPIADEAVVRKRGSIPGSLCIETQLPEEKSQLLVEMLLGLERNGEHDSSEALITALIRNRMQDENEPHGHLFDRILSNVEKIVIQHAFEECDRVQTRAADRLGIDRNTLHKKLRKYNLLRSESDLPTPTE